MPGIFLHAAFAMAGCAGPDSRPDGGGPADGGASPDGSMDGSFYDSGALDAASTDADSGGGDGGMGPFGFAVRRPQQHVLPCASCPGGTVDAVDMDYVCTLRWQSFDHLLYVQASPVSYGGFGVGFVYRVDGAFLSDGSVAEPVTATYDWGGNHNNDAIELDLPAQYFRFWHSSFGFGYRACQPMDCLQVRAPGNGATVEDGCTRDRAVPEICVRVTDDGIIPDLVDTFMRCPGDT